MDSCLTQDIEVSIPVWRKYSRAPTMPGYKDVTSLTPIVSEFLCSAPDSEGQLNSDHLFGKVREFDGSGECLIETVSKKVVKGFCKVTHLLDPIHTLKHYYKGEKGAARSVEKINNPMNQAYVDTLANYLLGQLRERGVSPHFCLFYGGFKAVADTYRFNITDEYGSFRRYKDFWNRKRAGEFALYVERDDDEDVESELFKTPQSSLRSTAFSCSSDSSDSDSLSSLGSIESLNSQVISAKESKNVELESVHSFQTGSSHSSDSSDESMDDNMYSVYSQFANYPVMMIFQERMEGVIDDMLEDATMVGAAHGSAEWEARWTAWTFQIIAALSAAQGVLGFTHNDLHTNNIVWITTEESWLFYKNRAGTVWRVPTYGRIFKIIDFGRSIFRVKDKWFVSDDYNYGGDAEGQYNFACAKNGRSKKIYPNPSFDLCRYAVSVMDALFPEMPVENLDGAVLSTEGSWVIHETVSPLWNLLWKWLLDKNGRNVLREEDGTERFPDFDLYNHITENVFNAKPQEYIDDMAFSSFKIDQESVGDWEKVYPLFC